MSGPTINIRVFVIQDISRIESTAQDRSGGSPKQPESGHGQTDRLLPGGVHLLSRSIRQIYRITDKLLQPDPEQMRQMFSSLQEEVEKEDLQNDFPDNSSAVG